MLSHWNHRGATYAGATQAQLNVGSLPRLSLAELDDPAAEPLTRFWVEETEVDGSLSGVWDRDWLFGWRDITNVGNERTFVPSVLPRAAVGNSFAVAFPGEPTFTPLLHAVWSSLVFDYIARQKASGSHMNYFTVKQLACPIPDAFEQVPHWHDAPFGAFVKPRVAELSYTSDRIGPYIEDILDEDPGRPFRWIPERREQIKAELDSAMLHLYGLDRGDAEHVLDSFSVLRKYEERDHGEFRTKRRVLGVYDSMTEAARTGVPFVSPLDPPPGYGPRHEEQM